MTLLFKKIPHPPVILGGSFDEITKLLDSPPLTRLLARSRTAL